MVSLACIELVKKFEGCRLESYRCPANVPTVGWGHTGREVHDGLEISQAQADAWLMEDLLEAEKDVRFLVGKHPVSENQMSALTSFQFNTGKLAGSTLLRKVCEGDFDGASNEFSRWVHASGKVLPGLVRRRAAEAELFESEDV
ncbi:lysozyme [Paramagnetospirillum kuznetsovii]|uniref:Lysozyme n=1 Tax=Paramagnetospirillum kuznetsovii TaxID=2053833 RepID=A0A364NVF5_9PROT|nr:lysozyme [Paramagnetospirillum kuznetsovii]RAU21069.1 lysozyme [Paramagnetospirillum kuznetsovii]